MGYLTTTILLVREPESEYEPGDSEHPEHEGPSPTESAFPVPDAPAENARNDDSLDDDSVDDDSLDQLGHEIAVLSAHIESATQRLLAMIARFDEGRGWESAGFRSCAEWLAHRTGIDRGAARERVRAARALRELPLIDEALARGELTFSKVRALTRVAEPETEGELLEMARGSTAAELERMVRGWKLGTLKEEEERDEWRHRNRCFSVFPDLDGSYVVKGRLTPEVGALLMRAIEAASDHLYRKETTEEAHYDTRGRVRETDHQGKRRKARDTEAAAARRRADALALLVERGMTVGLGGGDVSAEEPAPSGTSAERYQVMVHVDLATLKEPHPLDRATAHHRKRARKTRLDHIVEDVHISAETSRRLTCDASVVPVVRTDAEPSGPATPSRCDCGRKPRDGRAQRGQTSRRLTCDASMVPVVNGEGGRSTPSLNLGRRTRTVSAPLRRTLEARDRGCRFPGCGSRFTDAHHIRHWADGGETSLRNCILLCRHHHRLVHEGGWSVEPRGEGRVIFFDPRGGMHFNGTWAPPVLNGDPVKTLMSDNLGKGKGAQEVP